MTLFDKIKKMNTREFTEWLMGFHVCSVCISKDDDDRCPDDCMDGIMKGLEQEIPMIKRFQTIKTEEQLLKTFAEAKPCTPDSKFVAQECDECELYPYRHCSTLRYLLEDVAEVKHD